MTRPDRILLSAASAFLAFAGAAPATAAGDPAKGKTVFNQCMACHRVDASGKSSVGPNLNGVVGRPIASLNGFSYSPAMKGQKGAWTAQRLDAYLAGPMKNVPGSKMAFVGLKKPEDRQNVIAYLATLGK